MSETPPFDEGLASFLALLDAEGFRTDILWAFREDVTNCRRDYWVRVPLPQENASLARRYYEFGKRKGLGVTLDVLCRLGGRPVCYVWVPGDPLAASYAMQGPLKLKVPADPIDAAPVRSRWVWAVRRRLNVWLRCVTFAEELPSRVEVCRQGGGL
jgi:hypothetical protein